MRPDFSFLTALLLLGALLAPTGTADDTAPADPEAVDCSTRHLVTAVEAHIAWTGYACLTDGVILTASQQADSAIWLQESTPETVCTALAWHHGGALEWFGAPCGSVARPVDARATAPCEALDLAGQAARDVCGDFPGSSTRAAEPAIDCSELLSAFASVAAAELPCELPDPDLPDPDVPDAPNLRDLLDRVPEVPDPDVPEINCESLLSTFGASAAAAPGDCIPDIPDVPEVDCNSLLSAQAAAAQDCVGNCEPGKVGVTVGNFDACVNSDIDCDTLFPSAFMQAAAAQDCVGTCEDGKVGATIGTLNACVNADVALCDDGYGVIVNGNDLCVEPNVKLCQSPEVGVIVNGKRYCAQLQLEDCGEGYTGYEVNDVRACVRDVVLCDEGYGVEPNCHTARECEGPETGVEVDDTRVCRDVSVDRCDPPATGYKPACVTTQNCPPAHVGAIVNGYSACVPVPETCDTGYGVEPNCVTTCPPNYVGGHVGSRGLCYPIPQTCDVGYGVEPYCAILCPTGSVGAHVADTGACVPIPKACTAGYGVEPYCVSTCPSGYVGAKVGTTSVCTPTPRACPAPTVGLQPDCHTVQECAGSDVGVEVDGEDVVCRSPPAKCPAPETGYEPACVLIETCPDGYQGAVINGQEVCVPTPALCSAGYGVEPYCVTLCPSGFVGASVGSIAVCLPVPKACPVPTVGVQPDCHTATACPSGTYGVLVDGEGDCHTARECPGSETGVEVDNTRVCRNVNPVPCTPPETGYEPACVLVEGCGPGYQGAVINGLRVCTPDPRICQQGYGLEPNCATLCPSGTVGVMVGTTGLCYPIPQVCPVPTVGVQPDCHTLAACPSGTYGVLVDGEGDCHTVALCEGETYGVRVDSTDYCQGIPTVPDDQDGDGYRDTSELGYGSNPRDRDSRQTTDDDGDGTLNYREPYTGATYGRAVCTGAYGIVGDSSCGGYVKPVGLQSNSVGVDAEDRVWVWDGVCSSGAQGSYTACRTGNYAGSSTLYTGNFHSDGYGWRYVADVPLEDSETVTIVAPCNDFEQDNDADGVNVYHVCNVRVTVYRDGSTETEETGVRASAGDPDDEDPEDPVPALPDVIEDGPYTTIRRSTGDGVYYKVGAVVTVAGTSVDLIQEDTVDAGVLPRSFSVPTGESPTVGPDADGDGLPAYVEVPVTRWTIHDEATLTATTAPASPTRVFVDNDDEDPLVDEQSQTLPWWMQPGPDMDQDGVPSTVVIEYVTVTVRTDGSFSIERAPESDQTSPVDFDDSAEDDPVPQNEDPMPVTTGPWGDSVEAPPVVTPPVEERDVPTPGVTTPETCGTAPPCQQETPILEEDETTVPGTPGVGVPSAEELCADVPDLCDEENNYCVPSGIICVIPPPGQQVTEPTEPQTVPTPPVSAPAICQAAPEVCLPPITLIEEETRHFDGIGPVQVTPAVVVSVAWTGFDGYVDPNVGTFTVVGPIELPGLPLVVCGYGCSLPVPAEASGQGSVTVMVVAGDEEYVFTQPISF